MASEPRILVIVLAGGEGKRLLPLTQDRAKPAVPFAGSYRLIDFVLSNFANAGYLKIVVLTQYKSHSLDRHISQTWRFSTLLGNYVTPVPAQMRRGPYWFLGSADAIYQNLNLIYDERPDHVCVFGADHIYRMDPRQMVEQHVETGAGVTVAAIPVPREQASELGVMEVAPDGRILRFHEKAKDPPPMPDDEDRCLASMGNYVFETQALVEVVTPTGKAEQRTDIGGHVIPALTEAGLARSYDFSRNDVPGQSEHERGYWRDVGSLDAYYAANMDLIAPVPEFNLYNDAWPVLTHLPSLPPAKVSRGSAGEPSIVEGSLLCQGSIVSGGHVERSIVGPGAYVDHGARVVDSILFPGVRVGAGAELRRCVVDKANVVPPGFRIGADPEEDAARFAVSAGGVVVVAKGELPGPSRPLERPALERASR
ncbi:MAG: glucose-1-phosphate adenylyltransferase [Thermoleophilia bacterium]|nr:glucose-1-phosphate adenylyltransferase [Gaiellaceae bacterium]MDW8337671.1 glucose-1-phosphate adenylyltransferase [Thermoleophilia bacterium]